MSPETITVCWVYIISGNGTPGIMRGAIELVLQGGEISMNMDKKPKSLLWYSNIQGNMKWRRKEIYSNIQRRLLISIQNIRQFFPRGDEWYSFLVHMSNIWMVCFFSPNIVLSQWSVPSFDTLSFWALNVVGRNYNGMALTVSILLYEKCSSSKSFGECRVCWTSVFGRDF